MYHFTCIAWLVTSFILSYFLHPVKHVEKHQVSNSWRWSCREGRSLLYRNVKFIILKCQTCFLFQYTTNNFPGEYMPTTFDTFGSSKIVNNQVVLILLYNIFLWSEVSKGRSSICLSWTLLDRKTTKNSGFKTLKSKFRPKNSCLSEPPHIQTLTSSSCALLLTIIQGGSS